MYHLIWSLKFRCTFGDFFFCLGFLSLTFTTHRTAGEGEGYSFNSSLPLRPASERYLDISRVIVANSLPLRITSSWDQAGNLFRMQVADTKLRAICWCYQFFYEIFDKNNCLDSVPKIVYKLKHTCCFQLQVCFSVYEL